jgi:hypothetical protein
MTITIAAYGPRAGRAVFDGLRACERIGRQSIGGFVALAAITSRGALLRASTQRGGTGTLFVDGEASGVEPPEEFAEAVAAGLISSGPDRPEPLSQFLPADAKVGIVAGHRLPNARSVDGGPLNGEVLARLAEGVGAEAAVTSVMDRNPEADCGLIAVDLLGGVAARNSARVLRRPDVHVAMREDARIGARVIAMQNAILPYAMVAEVAATFAMDAMRGEPSRDGWVTLARGVPLRLGDMAAVHCDGALVAEAVTTTDATLLTGTQSGSAIYLNSLVYRDGAPVGRTLSEALCVIKDGRIQSFSGQERVRIPFTAQS